MASVNKVIMVCGVCMTPEVRYTGNGKAVCTLRVAVSDRVKKGDQYEEVASYFDVVTWDKTAENCGQYLDKGKQIYLEGRLQNRKFADKSGVEREKTEIVADRVVFLGGGNKVDGAANSSPRGAPAKKPAQGEMDDLQF